MARHVIVVMTNVWKDRHDEYNEWYDSVHVPDLLRIPGVIAAQRFRAGPPLLSTVEGSPYGYLSLYELETDDLPGVLAKLEEAMPSMAITKAIDIKDVTAYAFTALTERVEAAGASVPPVEAATAQAGR
jgi:hypothetical protein